MTEDQENDSGGSEATESATSPLSANSPPVPTPTYPRKPNQTF